MSSMNKRSVRPAQSANFSEVIEVYQDLEQASRRTAELIVAAAQQATAVGGRFDLALSGGETPRTLYSLLATEFRASIAWSDAHVFWVDERCVPPDHADSNYRMACETLLDHVPIPPSNVHRMRGEEEPERAAREYESLLRRHFGDDAPRFSFVLLGMGADGHTASLFPGSPALDERERLVVAVRVEKLRAYRLTLTPKAINGAVHIVFLVAGQKKAEALKTAFDETTDPHQAPTKLIRPYRGELRWIVDRAAMSASP